MLSCSHAKCPACSGSGIVSLPAPPAYDEKKVLRGALCRVWAIVNELEEELAAARRKDKNELAAALEKTERLESRIKVRDDEIAYLNKAIKVAHGWNGRPSENGPALKTRREFRREDEARKAEAEGRKPPPAKKPGKQPGTQGSSRGDMPTGTCTFIPETCQNCGGTDLHVTRIIRKRIYDLREDGAGIECLMYYIWLAECAACGATAVPHTDAIEGTSFGPRLRSVIETYFDGDAGQGSIRMFLEELHGAKLSAGAISHCRTAMARKLEGRAVDEPAVDGGCGRNPAAPRPIMGAILERASMDPHAATDETGGRVAGDAAQVLVSNTLHTTTIKVADSKGAADLRAQHNWMANRPAMRDGTSGFGWHNGPLGRCLVHVTRKSESLAIKHGHDSYQHVRHRMLLDVYKDAKKAAILITAAAGGPIRCASNLDAASKVPGLAETVKQYTASLTDRVRMIIDSFERDSLTTTLENALDNLFTGLRYPGMPLHNNSTELLIRRYIIPSRHRAPHPNKAAARNFSTHQTFIATCRKNGISPREAVLAMARDPCWDIFSSGIPPPIMTGAAAVSGRRVESAIPA